MRPRAPSRADLFGATYRNVVERIASNVRGLREARGWTQEEAAHRCNDLDITLWRMVESGRSNLTVATLARIVDGFGVDVADLMTPAPPLQKRPKGRPRKVDDVPVIEDPRWFIAAQERPPEDRPVGDLIDPDLMPPKKPKRK